MTNQLQPARIVAPSQVVYEEIEARGLTLLDFARQMGFMNEVEGVKKLIHSESITHKQAGFLAHNLGASAAFWLRLYGSYPGIKTVPYSSR